MERLVLIVITLLFSQSAMAGLVVIISGEDEFGNLLEITLNVSDQGLVAGTTSDGLRALYRDGGENLPPQIEHVTVEYLGDTAFGISSSMFVTDGYLGVYGVSLMLEGISGLSGDYAGHDTIVFDQAGDPPSLDYEEALALLTSFRLLDADSGGDRVDFEVVELSAAETTFEDEQTESSVLLRSILPVIGNSE